MKSRFYTILKPLIYVFMSALKKKKETKLELLLATKILLVKSLT